MSNELTVKDLFEKFKKCKDIDFTSVKGYNNCIKTGELFIQNLDKDYTLYDQTIEAVEDSVDRLQLEKSYKIRLANSIKEKDEDFSVVQYTTQLRFIRDEEVLSWKNLEQIKEVRSNKDLEIVSSNLLSLPYGSIFSVLFIALLFYFFNSLFSGKIFKLKLINQLELLEQEDLAELLKQDIQIQENTYTFIDRKIFKKQNMDPLSLQDKILVKNAYKHRDLIEEAYRKYMTPADDLNEDEIGKIQEEIRILLYEFYEKIGINVQEKSENLPFNDNEETE